MPTNKHRLWGARTFGMCLCAWIWGLLGFGAFREVSIHHPGIFHLIIPGPVRGSVWIASAVIAAIFAWSRRYSSVAIGFLWFMPGLQAVSYTYAWLLYLIPGGNPGYPAGWYAAALYLALIGLVILCALIPSPPVRQTVMVEEV